MSSASPDRHLVLMPGTREERQYVHVFCTQITRSLSGFFPSDFWDRFLPQLSQHNSTIRHAVVAVGAVYERKVQRALMPAPGDSSPVEHFELQQYNKAIRNFLEQMSAPEVVGVDMMLITCVLFICLEMLRTNNLRAMDHVQGGLQILAKHMREGKLVIRTGFDRELIQLFHRLNVQISFFGRPLQPLDVPIEKPISLSPNTTVVFDHISQARECLTDLLNRAMSLIREVAIRRVERPEPVTQKMLLDQQALAQEFYKWQAAFETMMIKSAKNIGITDARAPLVLQIEYHAILIWLKSYSADAETVYDQHFRHFDLVVSIAEKVIELGTRPDSRAMSSAFALDAEVLPPLYWTASRCRHPLIRRRAIEVARNYPTREGMWNQRRYVAAAMKIMEFEEAPVAHLPVEQRIPEEQHRTHDVLLSGDEEVQTNPFSVIFLWKPHGLNAHLERHREMVYW